MSPLRHHSSSSLLPLQQQQQNQQQQQVLLLLLVLHPLQQHLGNRDTEGGGCSSSCKEKLNDSSS